MTFKDIMQADCIRIIGAEYADIYDRFGCAWYTQGDKIGGDSVAYNIGAVLRCRSRRVFRACDDSGYTTVTIIAGLGEEVATCD